MEAATGSLGHGPAIGLGMALGCGSTRARHVWVLLGDSEAAEGSVWEAMEAAAHHEVGALTCVLDMNRLGQRGPTMHGWDADLFVSRAETFGWHALSIDGHDVAAIDARTGGRRRTTVGPLIVARTEKGHGVSRGRGQGGWHGKALPPDLAARAIEELGGVRSLTITPPKPEPWMPPAAPAPAGAPRPLADAVATRKAFGETLAWLAGERADLVVLDGEVGNSTYTEDVERSRRTASSSSTSPSRRWWARRRAPGPRQDGVRRDVRRVPDARVRPDPDGIDRPRGPATLRLARRGLDRGGRPLADGARGPRRLPRDRGSTVLYPADANATVRLVATMADRGHLLRPDHAGGDPVAVRRGRGLPDRGSKTLRDGSDVTIVAAGITVHEALRAADRLADDGVSARVLDCYSVKPIDASALRAAASETPADRRRGPSDRGRPRRRRPRRARRERGRHGARAQARGQRDAGVGLAGGAARLGRHRRRRDRRAAGSAG